MNPRNKLVEINQVFCSAYNYHLPGLTVLQHNHKAVLLSFLQICSKFRQVQEN